MRRSRWFLFRFACTMSFGLFGLSTFAYNTTMDSGSLLEPGQFRLGAETQFVTSGDEGLNFAGRFDGFINDEMNWKSIVGFGTTDFYFGGFVKWVPVPDTETQPAIGVIGGAAYAHYEDMNEIAVRAHPFVSKKFLLEFGDLTPYVALPISLRSVDGTTDVPVQLAIGTEFRPEGLEKINFLLEMGFNVAKSYSYVALGAAVTFDEENGIEFR